MADYQARKWRSWHHHMALVAMTLLFIGPGGLPCLNRRTLVGG